MKFNLPFLRDKNTQHISTNSLIEITEKGKVAAEESTFTGVRGQVLLKLDSGACTIKDVSMYSGIPINMIRSAVTLLINGGYAAKVGGY